MKRIFLLVVALILIIAPQMQMTTQTAAQIAMAETLKGGAVYEVIPKGFFGVWHVTSTTPLFFNPHKFQCFTIKFFIIRLNLN